MTAIAGFKVVPPLTIDDTNLTSSTAAESDYTAWSDATDYAVGANVTHAHRDYESLRTPNVNHNPATDATEPPYWLDLGPSNRYKAFDAERNTASTAASPYTNVITPGERVTAVVLFGAAADSATLSITSGGVGVYLQTQDLLSRGSRSWYEYLFGDFPYREMAFFFDLPPYVNAVLTLTLTRAIGNCSCESIVLGRAVDVGGARFGAESDILDFSRIDRDAFGNATLIPRKTVPKMNAQILIEKSNVNRVRRLRESLAGRPAAFVAITDASDGYAECLAQLGIFKRFPIVVEYTNHALCNLETEGL